MAHTWDEEMMRLHHVIADLKQRNATLRSMLTDAIHLADLAIKLDASKEGTEEGESYEPGEEYGWEGDSEQAIVEPSET